MCTDRYEQKHKRTSRTWINFNCKFEEKKTTVVLLVIRTKRKREEKPQEEINGNNIEWNS